MEIDDILKSIKLNKDNHYYLLGNLMLESLKMTSIIKCGVLYPEEDILSMEIVLPTKVYDGESDNDITRIANDFIAKLETLVQTEQIIKISTLELDAIGPKKFLCDWVKNPLTDSSYYTGWAYHLTKTQWEMLCSHYSI